MDKRTFTGIVIAAVLGLFPVTAALYLPDKAGETVKPQRFRQQFAIMGTVASFTLYCQNEAAFKKALELGRHEFEAVVKLANLRDETSELSRLNKLAYDAPFPCSEAMWFLLTRAEKAYLDSDRSFDITVKPLMDLWGFYRKRQMMPSAAEINSAKNKVGFDKLKLDSVRRTVQFTVRGMALDLGGIAKGYALDRAAQAIRDSGINCGILDLGGNLKLLEQTPPGKNFYTIGIKNPENPEELLAQTLKLPGNSAVSTSGAYERFVIIENRRYGHIIDPRTGIPAPPNAVTVTTRSALDSDIFSTSAYLGGKKIADKLSRSYPGTEFYFTESTTRSSTSRYLYAK